MRDLNRSAISDQRSAISRALIYDTHLEFLHPALLLPLNYLQVFLLPHFQFCQPWSVQIRHVLDQPFLTDHLSLLRSIDRLSGDLDKRLPSLGPSLVCLSDGHCLSTSNGVVQSCLWSGRGLLTDHEVGHVLRRPSFIERGKGGGSRSRNDLRLVTIIGMYPAYG